jgi:hypothetical protein
MDNRGIALTGRLGPKDRGAQHGIQARQRVGLGPITTDPRADSRSATLA